MYAATINLPKPHPVSVEVRETNLPSPKHNNLLIRLQTILLLQNLSHVRIRILEGGHVDCLSQIEILRSGPPKLDSGLEVISA